MQLRQAKVLGDAVDVSDGQQRRAAVERDQGVVEIGVADTCLDAAPMESAGEQKEYDDDTDLDQERCLEQGLADVLLALR